MSSRASLLYMGLTVLQQLPSPRATAFLRVPAHRCPCLPPRTGTIVASSPVVVFSKTYCPFCARVKKLLGELGASYKVVELDVESDGYELQSALADWTGQRTVPSVFIKGKHIGGCDDTMAMHKGGNLVPLLTEAGAIATPSL